MLPNIASGLPLTECVHLTANLEDKAKSKTYWVPGTRNPCATLKVPLQERHTPVLFLSVRHAQLKSL